MKKIGLVLMMLVCLSGCGEFDFDMLTCKYKQTYTTYEISYKNGSVKDFSIIKDIDLSTLSDENFDLYVKDAEKIADMHNEEKGIEEEVIVNQKVVTIRIDVDYRDYNVMKDELTLFSVRFEEDDFQDVETLRNTLIENGYACDEIVVK